MIDARRRKALEAREESERAVRVERATPWGIAVDGEGYRYDVFISYRRNDYWANFVKYLANELNGQLTANRPEGGGVFLDVTQIKYGADWPAHLATELSASRLFVPLLWNEYFYGKDTWCQAEMSMMLSRQAQQDESAEGASLIFPIEVLPTDMPRELSTFQTLNIQDAANAHITAQTPEARSLYRELRPFVAHLGEAASRAPAYDPSWRELATGRFRHLFERQPARQVELLGVR